MITWITAIIVFAIDMLTKYWIAGHEELFNVVIIPNLFHITYSTNTGMAFSLLNNQTILLTIISAIAIMWLSYYAITKPMNKFKQFVFGLLIGGAFGNFYDRLFLGYVRDFLDFYIFGYNYPVFNVADSALTIGILLLVIITLREEKDGSTNVDS